MKRFARGFHRSRNRALLMAVLGVFLYAAGAVPASAAPPVFRIGYMPIFPSAPEFIKAAKGWYEKELGVQVKEFRFSSGPPIVQAYAAGKIDIAYFGIGPAIVAVSKGIQAKVLASIVTGQVAVIARDQFAKDYKRQPGKSAFQKFAARNGRNMKIATFPAGSTPHVMLLYWLHQIGVDPKREVDIVPMGGAQVRQAVLAQRVDATMIMEPIITIIRKAGIPYRPVIGGNQILPGQPGSVLFVRQTLIDKYPAKIKKLVELHLRAIKFLRENRTESAKIISDKIGAKIVPPEMAYGVLKSAYIQWKGNPHSIVQGTRTYNQFQVKMGRFKKPLPINKLFDFRFYDQVVAEHPELKGY